MTDAMVARDGPRALARQSWSPGLPLAVAKIAIAAESPVPINEQICRALRIAIVAGDLPAGTLLPTSRELAHALGVGRNTVVAAYSRLAADGYLHSKFRRGTRVAPSPQSGNPAATLQEQTAGTDAVGEAATDSLEIGYQGQRALELHAGGDVVPEIWAGTPDPALYPRAILGRMLADAFGRTHFSDSDSRTPWRRFQEAIAAHFRQSRGVTCEPGQVVPITDASAALDLAARLLIDPGHAVLVEDPAPDEVRAAFHSANARLFALPCDSNGANPSAAKSPPPRLIYVSPSLSFPSGVQMSQERRVALLGAASACGAAVFEFDGFAELLYTGSRAGALQGVDTEGRVLYYGSLKNTLGPQFRVGFLVVPPNLAEAFSRLATHAGCVPESFVLAAAAGMIETSQYAQHVKKIRGVYASRLKLLVELCRALLPDAVITEPHGGLFLSLHLPVDLPAEKLASTAAKQGLPIAPFSRFSMLKPAPNGLVIGFGAIPDRLIEAAVRRLSVIVRDERDSSARNGG